jgi:transposase
VRSTGRGPWSTPSRSAPKRGPLTGPNPVDRGKPGSKIHGRRGIGVRIARKGVESSQRLGRHRWIVEACLSRLQRNRRLVRRYDRQPEHSQAFANLAGAPLAYRRLVEATN